MLLVNMYVINHCLFLNYLILFLQRYKKDKSVIGIKIKSHLMGGYPYFSSADEITRNIRA